MGAFESTLLDDDDIITKPLRTVINLLFLTSCSLFVGAFVLLFPFHFRDVLRLFHDFFGPLD